MHKCNYTSVFALRGSPVGEFSNPICLHGKHIVIRGVKLFRADGLSGVILLIGINIAYKLEKSFI